MTEPMTDAELTEVKRRALPSAPEYRMYAVIDRAHLIREVDRLNAALAETEQARDTAVSVARDNADAYDELRTELGYAKATRDRWKAERDAALVFTQQGAGFAIDAGTMALQEVKRLELERDQLKEINDRMAADRERLISEREASDGYHTFAELYEHRMMLTAHAVIGWTAAGYTVTKSRRHSDGELCFGGGWFIVTAELPTGQISYHYRDQHWDLFDIPEVGTPAEFDGHTPDDVVDRMKASLKPYSDATTQLASDSAMLTALEAAGVDNWNGYDCALEILKEGNDER